MMLDFAYFRLRGNNANHAAYRNSPGAHESTRQQIYAMISASSAGMTAREIAEKTGWALHTFSGRLAEMKRDELIRGTGLFRCGAEVLEVIRPSWADQIALLDCA